MRKLKLLVAGCLLLAATANASESTLANDVVSAQGAPYRMDTGLEGTYSLPSGRHIKVIAAHGGLYLELPNGYRRALHWDGHSRFLTGDSKISVRLAPNGSDVLFAGLE